MHRAAEREIHLPIRSGIPRKSLSEVGPMVTGMYGRMGRKSS